MNEYRMLKDKHDEMDIRDVEGLAESIYPVKCDCGFSGMSDDCRYLRCPNCGDRVAQEYDDYRSNEDMESYKRGGR